MTTDEKYRARVMKGCKKGMERCTELNRFGVLKSKRKLTPAEQKEFNYLERKLMRSITPRINYPRIGR